MCPPCAARQVTSGCLRCSTTTPCGLGGPRTPSDTATPWPTSMRRIATMYGNFDMVLGLVVVCVHACAFVWCVCVCVCVCGGGVSAPHHHARAVWHALLGDHAYRMLIGACNPVVRPIHVFRPTSSAGPCRRSTPSTPRPAWYDSRHRFSPPFYARFHQRCCPHIGWSKPRRSIRRADRRTFGYVVPKSGTAGLAPTHSLCCAQIGDCRSGTRSGATQMCPS